LTGFRGTSMDDVLFVGQAHYYRCHVPKAARFLDIRPDNYDPKRYEVLLQHKAKVWVFFRGEYVPAAILRKLDGVKIWISTEPLGRDDVMSLMRDGGSKGFDAHYHYDGAEVDKLCSCGIKTDGEFVMPVDLETYRPYPALQAETEWDVFFSGRETPKRNDYLGILCRDYDVLWLRNGVVGAEWVYMLNRCKVAVNIGLADEIPGAHPRLPLSMACGVCMVSTPVSPAIPFKHNEHCVFVNTRDEFVAAVLRLRDDAQERERIGRNGYWWVRDNLDAAKEWPKLIKKHT